MSNDAVIEAFKAKARVRVNEDFQQIFAGLAFANPHRLRKALQVGFNSGTEVFANDLINRLQTQKKDLPTSVQAGIEEVIKIIHEYGS